MARRRLGGQVTNSPPSNVRDLEHGELARVLASGIDTLYLAVNLKWTGEGFFDYLRTLKAKAIEAEQDQPGQCVTPGGEDWQFVVRPYGMKGYEWLLESREYRVDLGGWAEPKQRPSAMAYLGSETLWRLGAHAAVGRVLGQLAAAGATVQIVKPSRVDLTVDLLLPAEAWCFDLARLFSTRGDDVTTYTFKRKLTGFKIGSGNIVARLYDKPAEIARKRQKLWMFDVWGIPAAPVSYKIIRVEFQLRREALREFGIDTYEQLRERQAAVWAYCTQRWLKVQDHPERHATRRHTLPWWIVVQNGFSGAQGGTPAVRRKAIRTDEEQLSRQLFGLLTSMMALQDQSRTLDEEGMYTLVGQLPKLMHTAHQLGLSDEAITERVVRKLAKYRRRMPESSGAAGSGGASSGVPF